MKYLIRRKLYLVILFAYSSILLFETRTVAQSITGLNLKDAIKLATDSSLAAFKAENLYLSGYWEYRTYKAQQRPHVSLNSTPGEFTRSLLQVYNSELGINQFESQQYLYNYGDITIDQNLPFTGGTISFTSELYRLQYFGISSYKQYYSVPFQVSLDQKLFGFNSFKWKKKIEPLKYEKVKKTYLQAVEKISVQTIDYFFDLALAKMKLQMAQTNKRNADTLYNIGVKRMEIASLSLSDVLTLKVDALNAQNDIAEAEKVFEQAQFTFKSYLRLQENQPVELVLPDSLIDVQLNLPDVQQMAETNNPDITYYQQQQLEARRDLEQTKRDNRFTATLSASYGYNQQNKLLNQAYRDLLDQQIVSLSLKIPLLDWGENKGKYNMAKKNMEIVNTTIQQSMVDFRKSIFIVVTNFNMQSNIVKSKHETQKVAQQAYEITKQRFLIGKADVSSLTLVLNRQDDANISYINALYSFWKYYYTVRELTLFDFEKNTSLMQNMDRLLNVE
jgi:outer membrane protein TolC